MPTRFLLAAVLLSWATTAIATGEPENLRLAAEGVYVGGLPEGDAAWDALARLGVRTIVGVDGLPPDAASAHARSIRPIHIPVAYAGVDAAAAGQLTRVAREAERPVYVYCHHGKHRGPAAAAILCRAATLLDSQGAIVLLQTSRTDPDYVGLWRSVRDYEPPSRDAALPPLVERAETPPLRLAMSQLDRAWDALQGAPDARTRDDLLILARDALDESARAATAEGLAELRRDLTEARRLWEAVESAPDDARFDKARAALEASCVDCHNRRRDNVAAW